MTNTACVLFDSAVTSDTDRPWLLHDSYKPRKYTLSDYQRRLLLERYDGRKETIARAGLPVPPKSSCWFCPYHRLSTWREMRDKEPALFAQAVALEQRINEKRARIGKDNVWLTDRLKPLDKAVGDASQPSLFEDDACESGFCMV